jgi:hypothetical protein
MTDIAFKPNFLAKICWGLPDSPVRPLCAICHGALPAVPLQIWRADGAGATLCDKCANQAIAWPSPTIPSRARR